MPYLAYHFNVHLEGWSAPVYPNRTPWRYTNAVLLLLLSLLLLLLLLLLSYLLMPFFRRLNDLGYAMTSESQCFSIYFIGKEPFGAFRLLGELT